VLSSLSKVFSARLATESACAQGGCNSFSLLVADRALGKTDSEPTFDDAYLGRDERLFDRTHKVDFHFDRRGIFVIKQCATM
jgi:hypothetical protein